MNVQPSSDVSPVALLEYALLATYRAVGIDATKVVVNVHVGFAQLTYRDQTSEEQTLTVPVPKDLLRPLLA